MAFSASRIETLLSAVPADELLTLLGRRRYMPLHHLVDGSASELSEAQIARYAVALDGPRLLRDPAVLAALLLHGVSSAELMTIARKHLVSPFRSDADNALVLASRPLRPGASLTCDVFAALQLPLDLLDSSEKKAAVETVEPYEALPALLDFQSSVRGRCVAMYAAGVRECLIQMPTGAGKTRTAMEIAVDLINAERIFAEGRAVIWLAHTEELCEQAIEAFSSVWITRGTGPARIARLWGPYVPELSAATADLIVAGTSRMHALGLNEPNAIESLAGRCTIVFIDEAHRALAPTIEAQIMALRRVRKGLLVGLSATPIRGVEAAAENARLAALFGNNLVSPDLGDDPIDELRRRGILAELERVVLEYEDSEEALAAFDAGASDDLEAVEDLPEAVLASLAANVHRNAAIIRELECRGSQQSIVFCCSVAHAELLAAVLRLKGLSAASVDCRMRRGERRKVIERFARGEVRVLLNFGVLSTGFDAPNVRNVVIARPTRSVILYSQMLGRGLRGPKMGGTPVCTLIDVRDHLSRFGDLNDLYVRFSAYWTRKH